MLPVRTKLLGALTSITGREGCLSKQTLLSFQSHSRNVTFRTSHRQISTAPPSHIAWSNVIQTQKLLFSSTRIAKMASDEDYMTFLNKANQDLSDGQATAAANRQQGNAFKTTDAGSQLPKAIQDVCENTVYVTDADEPFEGVSLKWTGEGGLPDEAEFAQLIQHWDVQNAQIEILDPFDWDSRGQYSNVIEAVREASRGNDVRVYKVTRDHTRVEYWVISRDDKEGRIVGVKALGIES